MALADLQKVDMEAAALRKAGEGYPRQLSDLEKELASARSAVEAERNRLSDIERQRRELESNIASEKDKVKKWEGRLAEQRSPREYAALAREIDIARKSNITLGETLIELGKSYTVQLELVKGKERELGTRQQSIQERIASVRQSIASTLEKVRNIESGRAAVAAQVDRTLMQRYDLVRKKRMPALVAVKAATCQGCNMNIPSQQYNLLVASRGTDICPTCHRLIYAAEALEPTASAQSE